MTEPNPEIQQSLEIVRSELQSPEALLALASIEAYMRRRERDAVIDERTQIGNVRALQERKHELEILLAGQGRRELDRQPYAVVVASADIIGLKQLNETYSQVTGDEVIITVAQSLDRTFRPMQWFRRGGDEFVGLFDVYNAEEIEAVRQKLAVTVPRQYKNLRPVGSVLPQELPLRCGVVTAYGQLEQAEQQADPKHAHPDNLVQFSA